MTGDNGEHLKKEWVTPHVVRYGSVREITKQFKQKIYGNSDDVLVNNQSILKDAS